MQRKFSSRLQRIHCQLTVQISIDSKIFKDALFENVLLSTSSPRGRRIMNL